MKEYKKYLTETLKNFFEAMEQTLISLLGFKDTTKPGIIVIRISHENFYDIDEKEDFDNPDFFNGYSFVSKGENNITIIQKLNLTKISNTIKLTLEETKDEVKEFINKALYYFDIIIGGEKGENVGKGGYSRIMGHVSGKDYRGYYTIEKVINENVETQGDVYLVSELLLKLKESTSYEDEDEGGRKNVKGSRGLKVGAAREVGDEDDEDEPSEIAEPSEKEMARAQREFQPTED